MTYITFLHTRPTQHVNQISVQRALRVLAIAHERTQVP